MSAIDSRKCAATVAGWSPVSTVTPPRNAWAKVPTSGTIASRTTGRRVDRDWRLHRRTQLQVPTAAAMARAVSTKVSIRLPNSM